MLFKLIQYNDNDKKYIVERETIDETLSYLDSKQIIIKYIEKTFNIPIRQQY